MDTKIRQFPQRSGYHNYLDYTKELSDLAEQEDYINMKRELLDNVKSMTGDFLKGIDRNIGRMELADDNFEEFLNEENDQFSLYFESSKGYLLEINIKYDDAGEAGLYVCLSRQFKDGRMEFYDIVNNEWHEQELPWFTELLDRGDVITDFLMMCLEQGLVSEEPEDEKYFYAILQESNPLIELVRQSEFLMSPDVLDIYEKDCPINRYTYSQMISGIAVLWEDGECHILQYCPDDIPSDDPEMEGCFYKSVFHSGDLNLVRKSLEFMLDHHFAEPAVIFPLSDKAYAKGTHTFGKFKIVKDKDRALTKEEKENYAGLQAFFSTKKLTGKQEA